MTALPVIQLRTILTGLRGYCKAPALSAILLSSERQPWGARKGTYSVSEISLWPEDIGYAG